MFQAKKSLKEIEETSTLINYTFELWECVIYRENNDDEEPGQTFVSRELYLVPILDKPQFLDYRDDLDSYQDYGCMRTWSRIAVLESNDIMYAWAAMSDYQSVRRDELMAVK